MKVEIDSLTEKELIELNHRVVERLKFLESVRAHAEMMEFSVGDKVCFHSSSRDITVGILVKYNKKTVTVLTEDGQKWNVSPHLLEKAKSTEGMANTSSKVVEFKPK